MSLATSKGVYWSSSMLPQSLPCGLTSTDNKILASTAEMVYTLSSFPQLFSAMSEFI